MASDSSTRQSVLKSRYGKLTLLQRSVVQVFALLYEPTSRPNAYSAWNTAIPSCHLETQSKPFKPYQFSAQITALIKINILIQEGGQGPCCPPLLREIAIRDAVQMRTFEPLAQAIQEKLPFKQRYGGSRYFRYESEWLRELRIAIYRQNQAEIDALWLEAENAYWQPKRSVDEICQEIFNNPFDPDWLRRLSPDFRQRGLRLILAATARQCTPADAVFEIVEDLYLDGQADPDICLLYAQQLWLRGHLQEVRGVLSATEHHPASSQRSALQGAIAFLTGQLDEALAHYRAGLKQVGKPKAAQAEWFQTPAAALYFLALLKAGSPDDLQAAEKLGYVISAQENHWLKEAMPPLLAVLQNQQGRINANAAETFFDYTLTNVGIAALLEVYSLYWLDVKDLQNWLVPQLVQQYKTASQANYGWIAMELAELMAHLEPEDEIYSELATGLRESMGSQPLIETVKRQEAWELSLNALTQLTAPPPPEAAAPESEYRLAWRLLFRSPNNWQLTPIEQKLSVKGGWTKGRVVAMSRLEYTSDMPDCATQQDRQIAKNLKVEYEYQNYYGASKPTYRFKPGALLALVGHPLVFWEESPTVRVDVVAGEPELLVQRQSEERLHIKLAPQISEGDEEMLAFKETPTRLKVIKVGEPHRRIAQLLGTRNCLEVPAHAQEQVLAAIAAISELVT
ncbi:MAG: hypothetical protein ACPGVO_16875, partial [Spirulinaceae cyanobacterium]